MRERTLFGIFSHATAQIWFGVSIVVLRVIVGLSCFLFGLSRLGDWSVVDDLTSMSFARDWFLNVFAQSFFEHLLIWLMIVCGVCLMLGALTRPASFLLILSNAFVYAWLFNPDVIVSREILLIICLCLFLSGGIGHVLGFDYFLYSYARQRTWVTKMLVG
jgi:uncharacterized membrane protein YphA (DoxX/SURF4 family)